jgi:hypothetical protein
MLLTALAGTVCVAQDLVSIIHGTVTKVDKATKTVAVKTADGTEQTVKVRDQAVVHGSKDGFDGLKTGSDVRRNRLHDSTEFAGLQRDLHNAGENAERGTRSRVTRLVISEHSLDGSRGWSNGDKRDGLLLSSTYRLSGIRVSGLSVLFDVLWSLRRVWDVLLPQFDGRVWNVADHLRSVRVSHAGTSARTASTSTVYGKHSVGQAYNRYTGTYGATHQGSSPKTQWGQSYVSQGNKSATTQHYSGGGGYRR